MRWRERCDGMPPVGGMTARQLRVGAIIVALAVGVVLLWRPLAQVLGLLLGAGAICFVAAPLARLYERRMPRPLASLLSLLTIAAALLGGLWLLLPAMLREAAELGRVLPASFAAAAEWLGGARRWLEGQLSGVALPEIDLGALQGALSGLATGTLGFAANLADVAGRVSMMAVLAYFFMRDRDTVLLRLELLLPQKARATAVRMAGAACRELRLYLKAQCMIAGAVAVLSFAALTLVGVRSALALAPLIGVLNMIPYFGPYIGGVPAVLIALTDGWQKAALTALALVVVQQLDGSWISPKVMGSLTGFSPALVLVGIYAGARLGGVAGMLLAMPAMLVFRSLYRIFMQKCENI